MKSDLAMSFRAPPSRAKTCRDTVVNSSGLFSTNRHYIEVKQFRKRVEWK